MMIIMPASYVAAESNGMQPPDPDFLEETPEDGTTPLDPDEAEGLIPELLTRGELNAWEQTNILKAEQWAFGRRIVDVLTSDFAVELHRRMFNETWSWAGTFRRSDKNIGVHWPNIPQGLQDVLGNARYWLENTTYSLDETAARLHHRLVSIHPFPNGNGRHGRLVADLLLWNRRVERFSWGRGRSATGDETRKAYLAALREADQGNLEPLLRFVRS